LKTLNNKAQIFSVDLIVASIVFLFILVLSHTYSTEISNRIYFMEQESQRINSAQDAVNSLLYSSGYPANWHNLSSPLGISSLGIVKTRNIIDAEKISRLEDFNSSYYDEVRSLLGVGKYGLRISLIDMDTKNSLAEFGLEPSSTDKVSSVNRIAFYEGSEVLLRVKVFE